MISFFVILKVSCTAGQLISTGLGTEHENRGVQEVFLMYTKMSIVSCQGLSKISVYFGRSLVTTLLNIAVLPRNCLNVLGCLGVRFACTRVLIR